MNIFIAAAFLLSLLQFYACLKCDLQKVKELGEATLLTLKNTHDILRTGEALSQMLKTIYPTHSVLGLGTGRSKPDCNWYWTIHQTLEQLDPIHDYFTNNRSMNVCINSEWGRLFVKLRGLQLLQSNNNTLNKVRNEIGTLCTDRYKGITRFVSFYLKLLRESKVKQRLRECLKYDSIQLEHFIRNNILRMNQIWILVGVCEEETGRKTEFEKDVFVRDVTRYLSYIQSTLVLREFISDKYGLKTLVKQIAEQTSNELVEVLNKNYGYYKWQAVRDVADFTIGNSFGVPGRYIFEEAKTKRTVFVQWTKQINWMNLLKCEVNCTPIQNNRYKVALKNITLVQDAYSDARSKHNLSLSGNLNDTVRGTNISAAYSTLTFDSNGPVYLDDDYIKLPVNKFLNTEFTVTMWIKFKVYTESEPLFRFGSRHRNNSIVVSVAVIPGVVTSLLIVLTDDFGYDRFHPLQSIELLEWSHYVFVYSYSSLCVYIDSRFLTCSAHLNFAIDKTDENYIGREHWANNRNLNAFVYDFKIYNKSLTRSGIRKDSGAVYNFRLSKTDFSSSLIHYWPFDSSLIDVVSGLNGSLNGILNFTKDYYGNESAIDLSHGSIQLPSSLYLTVNLTISAWVKLKEYRNGQVLFSCSNGSSNQIQIRLSEAPHNYFYLFFSPSFNYDIFPSYVQLELNKWRHLTVAVSHSLGIISMYINGELIMMAYDEKFDFKAGEWSECFVGHSSKAKSKAISRTNAAIGELKVFNRFLTDEEVFENIKTHKTSINGGLAENNYEYDEYDLEYLK